MKKVTLMEVMQKVMMLNELKMKKLNMKADKENWAYMIEVSGRNVKWLHMDYNTGFKNLIVEGSLEKVGLGLDIELMDYRTWRK